MAATKQFIEDAIEGGINEGQVWTLLSVDDDEVIWRNGAGRKQSHQPEFYLLRPDVWQAVGKTRGWKPANCPLRHHPHSFECEKWREKMLNLIQHIQEGSSIEEALAKL